MAGGQRDRRWIDVRVTEGAGQPQLATLEQVDGNADVVGAHPDEHGDPPGRRVWSAAWSAAGLPEHSISASNGGSVRSIGDAASWTFLEAQPEGELEPRSGDVGDPDLAGTEGARGLATSRPIGPAPVTSTRSPALTRALRHAHTAHRQRLDQRPGLVRHRGGKWEREILVDGEVAGQRPVDGWRPVEPDLGAHVVAAGPAIATAPHGTPGSTHTRCPTRSFDTSGPERDHPPARLVAEDERLGHNPKPIRPCS